MKAIINGKFIVGDSIIENKALLFDEKIVGFVDSVGSDVEVIDADGCYVSAGFIDIHIHGSGGYDVMDATYEALESIAGAIVGYGTTSYLPTTMTMSRDDIHKALDNIKSYKPNKVEPCILGVHMEGPFINPIKTGAQDSRYIMDANIELIDEYMDIIRMITIAPEVSKNLDFISYMSKNHPEIVLSIGHSNATYEESIKSFKCGISHATHMFNAMPSYHHREVGVIGAVLDDDSVSCDVIADTIHTHHTTLSLLYRQKKSNLMLITDSMRAGCIKDGVYDLGGQAVYVKDGKATLPSGVLAGSVLKLNQAVSNMLKYSNASIQEVIAMVTELPAKKLGINKGLLEIGYDTDIVIFDTDIDIKLSIISGKVAYKKE